MHTRLWLFLLPLTPSLKSFSQVIIPSSTGFATLALRSANAPLPFNYAFDDVSLSDKQRKTKRKQLNHQFDSLSREIAKHENDAQLYFERGMVKKQSMAYSGAKEDFDKSYHLGNRSRELLLNLGIMNYNLRQRANSVFCFNTILRKDSTDAEAYLHRGIAKWIAPKSKFSSFKERCQEAIPDFTLALKYHPNYKPTLIMRGYAYFIIESNAAAIADLSAATELTPKNEFAFILLGKVYIETNQFQKACDTFAKAKENGFEVPKKLLRQACGK